MARTYRLHVLECDTPIDPVLNARGTYGSIIGNLFERGLEQYKSDGGANAADLELKVTKSNMVDLGELPKPDEVDALVLSVSSMSHFSFLNALTGRTGLNKAL